MQKFYNRESQLRQLRTTSDAITTSKGQLSVVVGRRRVGKTRLLKEAFSDQAQTQYLYLFIARKPEAALVHEFTGIIQEQCNNRFFKPSSLREVFDFLFEYGKTQPLTLVVDEFQDVELVNSGLFSDLQNLWDSHKQETNVHWVTCGSLYSSMTRIFKGSGEPLFNRQDQFFQIMPLTPSYIREVMADNGVSDPDSQLMWWCLSGGIPKYLEWLAPIKGELLPSLLVAGSPIFDEGQHRLVEDFGSEHQFFFGILSAIAQGYNQRSQIEDYLGRSVGPQLEVLDTKFETIEKMRPIGAKANARGLRYRIRDPFLRFWFAFIYQNRSAVEMENYGYLQRLLERDYDTFSGIELESLFTEILKESRQFNRLGGFWDRKGLNEIDIVAINDLDKRVLVIEVKRQSQRFDAAKLDAKCEVLRQKLKLPGYIYEQRCFALDTFEQVLADFPPADVAKD